MRASISVNENDQPLVEILPHIKPGMKEGKGERKLGKENGKRRGCPIGKQKAGWKYYLSPNKKYVTKTK